MRHFILVRECILFRNVEHFRSQFHQFRNSFAISVFYYLDGNISDEVASFGPTYSIK